VTLFQSDHFILRRNIGTHEMPQKVAYCRLTNVYIVFIHFLLTFFLF